MNAYKHVTKIAAAMSLGLLAGSFAHAHDSIAATGSTDIYSTNFQETYPSGNVIVQPKGGPIDSGSTDIWGTDFQNVFATKNSVGKSPAAETGTGSTDIYFTNFQRTSL
jgi:hypothetical protein